MDKKKPMPSGRALETRKRKDAPSAPHEAGNQSRDPRPNSRVVKRVKVTDARHIRSQPPDAALDDGNLDLQKFLDARKFEIKALEESMRKTKALSATRAFQQVPRAMRRRTASHNVKRVPKRLRARARHEQIEDNTPTIESRKRRPRTTRARIRAETAKRLQILAARQKKRRLEKRDTAEAEDTAKSLIIQARAPRPKIRRDALNEPPKNTSKFRKRQVEKTWLPTHLWHAKRATMTEPTKPLWRFAVPLTSTEKCYRPTHRASGQKGVVVWDMSYMSTIGLYGTYEGVQRALKSLGLNQESLWGARGQKWRTGLRKWSGILSKQRKEGTRYIGPATIVWNPEAPIGSLSGPARARKPQRQLLIRTHPSCFLELFNELLKLAKMQSPQLHVEDLRFEVGSIELAGPGSTEALLGILTPYHDKPEAEEHHGRVFRSLEGVTNPAALPKDVVLAFSARDPRLAYPPKTIGRSRESESALLHTLTNWPADDEAKPFDLLDRDYRHKASQLPSQKSINRRKGSNLPGKAVNLSAVDPPIPVMLFASRPAVTRQTQGTWILLAPWKCILPLWYSLVHYPLSTGGNPRLGGLNEQRQIAFEHGSPWFPGDFPGTDAGCSWELEERERRKRDWDRRPKGKRIEWRSLDLGAGRKGEVGDGLACDFEHLFGLNAVTESSAAESSNERDPDMMELDEPQEQPRANPSPPSALLAIKQITKTAFNGLIAPSNLEPPPKRAVVTVNVTMVGRGVANTCARIYRLPRKPSVAEPSSQAEVPATIPPVSTGSPSLPWNLREQWLAELPLKPTNANSIKGQRVKKQPAAPRMTPGTDLATRTRLLAKSILTSEIPHPKMPANQVDVNGHPLCPDEDDLIGFVTTGAFSLSEGKATAVGSVSAEKAKETIREQGMKEGMLCIVRNAGENARLSYYYPWRICSSLPKPQRPTLPVPADASISTGKVVRSEPMVFTFPSPADQVDAAVLPPELNEVEYFDEVLHLPGGKTDVDVENELIAKATALGLEIPATIEPSGEEPSSSSDESGPGVGSHHGRTGSTSTNGSAGTDLTSQTSHHSATIPPPLGEPTNPAATRRYSKNLSFSQYEKYLGQLDPALSQPKFHSPHAQQPGRSRTLFTSATKRKGMVKDFKRSLTTRLRRRQSSSAATLDLSSSCICCREEFAGDQSTLKTLPCGHQYCQDCLAVMIAQSTTDESKMPPRCCTQPIPTTTIKTVLTRDEQYAFLKAVLQYSTPWESRIFCPNASCGEFIPPSTKIDPKHPFETVCKSCKTRVCIMCKRNAHRLGQDCPEDWELDAVLKIGEKLGWRRCYKCKALVELSMGCTHVSCRCKGQFCYICGAVWDRVVGCPNFCNGEEEMERRRIQEEARLAMLEAEKEQQEREAAEEDKARQEAEKRTSESETFKRLMERQRAEMARFVEFERKMEEAMRARHVKARVGLAEKHQDLTERMKERHAKTEQHLEDRQIEAEIELRAALEQSEKSVRIQLKYMEAYCKGLTGKAVDEASQDMAMPSRQVTEKHLEQLNQQYLVRDGMEQRHQSQINVLREKQAKRMEELMERHEAEMEALEDRKNEEIEDLAVKFTNDKEALLSSFQGRRSRLSKMWMLASEILRAELQTAWKTSFAPMPPPEWPMLDAGSGAAGVVLETEEEG
ncbi:ribonucleases P/MRP protein subunit POP1 [Echria macrotheca]|uniref:Ribonucleases P/MRP protein subunit POP1 n=1 Tax=Echria macrotheca TaxID=438768 RepID=A0AAJ0F0N2_9PEZI|nr:ribonucleases P/MRP protein subunit POP1 [Echria macrotheca]